MAGGAGREQSKRQPVALKQHASAAQDEFPRGVSSISSSQPFVALASLIIAMGFSEYTIGGEFSRTTFVDVRRIVHPV